MSGCDELRTQLARIFGVRTDVYTIVDCIATENGDPSHSSEIPRRNPARGECCSFFNSVFCLSGDQKSTRYPITSRIPPAYRSLASFGIAYIDRVSPIMTNAEARIAVSVIDRIEHDR
jgi:hypothetical protein